MAMDVFELYEELCSSVNAPQGGHIRPHRNFIAWLNTAQLEIFKELYKQYEVAQVISDELSFFQKSINLIVPSGDGRLPYDTVRFSDDYQYFAGARFQYGEGKICGSADLPIMEVGEDAEGKCTFLSVEDGSIPLTEYPAQVRVIEKVTANRWAGLFQRKTLQPSEKNPKCSQFGRELRIAPCGLGIIVLDYFRLPKPAKLAYTVIDAGTENEYIQYDKANSVQLEWSAGMRQEFLTRLRKAYGGMTHNRDTYEQAVIEQKNLA